MSAHPMSPALDDRIIDNFSAGATLALADAVQLEKKQVHKLDYKHIGKTISCLRGRVWVTQEKDYNDYILEPGQEMKITSYGRVTVQALDRAAITVF